MIKIVKRVVRVALKLALSFICFLALYFAVAYVFTKIIVNKNQAADAKITSIFIATNGVHTDVILPLDLLDSSQIKNIYYLPTEKYLSMGWGDKNFYINTPEWADLTAKNALQAMFWKSSTLMHVTRYSNKREDWKEVKVSKIQLEKLIEQSFADFKKNSQEKYELLANESYGATDNFYEAKGSYHCFKTCNTWTNSVLKKSGLKAAFWTPFDFGVMNKY